MGLPPLGCRAVTGLVLVRHGATDLNLEGRCQGWIDPDLNGRGVRQARAAGAALRTMGVRPTEVWSSDLLRARRTAELLVPDAAVRTDRRLRELAFGSWEGRAWDEVRSTRSKAFLGWARDPEAVAPPGGETLGELRARMWSWIASVRGWRADVPAGPPDGERPVGPWAGPSWPLPAGPPATPSRLPSGVSPGEAPEVARDPSRCTSPVPSLVVVAHGGPIRLLLARHLALPPTWEVESRLSVPPGAVFVLGAGA